MSAPIVAFCMFIACLALAIGAAVLAAVCVAPFRATRPCDHARIRHDGIPFYLAAVGMVLVAALIAIRAIETLPTQFDLRATALVPEVRR